MKRNHFIIVISLFLFSCLGSEFERNEIVGNYHLTTTDHYKRDVYIDFKLPNGDFIGVLSSSIFAVGHSEKYIIAKQHPFTYPTEVDTAVTNYYILPVYNNTLSPEKGILGPLSLKKFQSKKTELGISNIKFIVNLK